MSGCGECRSLRRMSGGWLQFEFLRGISAYSAYVSSAGSYVFYSRRCACFALRQSRALIRWPLRSSAHREGNPGNRTSTRAFAALGPQRARPARPKHPAERSDGPKGCWLPTPSGCVWGAQGAGWRVCRRTYPLRQLTRRGCLNGAPQARSEFHGAPRTRAPQVAGYWGQTPISLRCAAPHPPGEPKAR